MSTDMSPPHPQRPDRGSASLEAVLVVPAFCLFIGLVIALGRIEVATQHVDQAAAEAARAGSLARDAATAHSHAQTAALATLDNDAVRCQSRTVDVDTSGFSIPVGTPAVLRTTVACQLTLSDVALPGLPGTVTLTGHGASPLDLYRGRK